jgi:hypothetical protein
MNILKQAAKGARKHQFDLIIDAVEAEVPYELQQFVKPRKVMVYIRTTGIVPDFVTRHCVKILRTVNQPALL